MDGINEKLADDLRKADEERQAEVLERYANAQM